MLRTCTLFREDRLYRPNTIPMVPIALVCRWERVESLSGSIDSRTVVGGPAELTELVDDDSERKALKRLEGKPAGIETHV